MTSIQTQSPAPTQTQQSLQATSLDWTSIILPALGLGTVLATAVGALVKAWGDQRLEKERQKHEKQIDEVHRQHELEMQRLKIEYAKDKHQFERRIELMPIHMTSADVHT